MMLIWKSTFLIFGVAEIAFVVLTNTGNILMASFAALLMALGVAIIVGRVEKDNNYLKVCLKSINQKNMTFKMDNSILDVSEWHRNSTR